MSCLPKTYKIVCSPDSKNKTRALDPKFFERLRILFINMTGLLYFIVIGMWASVLIPIALKNHDRRNLEKSLLPEGQTIPRWRWQTREKLSPRQVAFVRRRRVAMTLLTALVLSVVMSSAGQISFAWVILPATLLFGFGYLAAKRPAPRPMPMPVTNPVTQHQTQIIPTSKIVVEKVVEQKVEVQKRTWLPAEPVAKPQVAAVDRRWTSQEMIDAAIALRQQREEKLREAHARLEEARAIAMENARRAAMAANQNNGNPVTPFRRAANQ